MITIVFHWGSNDYELDLVDPGTYPTFIRIGRLFYKATFTSPAEKNFVSLEPVKIITITNTGLKFMDVPVARQFSETLYQLEGNLTVENVKTVFQVCWAYSGYPGKIIRVMICHSNAKFKKAEIEKNTIRIQNMLSELNIPVQGAKLTDWQIRKSGFRWTSDDGDVKNLIKLGMAAGLVDCSDREGTWVPIGRETPVRFTILSPNGGENER